MDEPYANRELDDKFKAADDRADEFHEKLMDRMDVFELNTKEALSRIEEQTTKTNGRVRWLEKMMYCAVGGLAVLTSIVIPVLLAYIQAGKI